MVAYGATALFMLGHTGDGDQAGMARLWDVLYTATACHANSTRLVDTWLLPTACALQPCAEVWCQHRALLLLAHEALPQVFALLLARLCAAQPHATLHLTPLLMADMTPVAAMLQHVLTSAEATTVCHHAHKAMSTAARELPHAPKAM